MDKHPLVQDSPDAWSMTLYEAASRGDIDRMRYAVARGADVDFREGANKSSCLHAAANAKQLEAVEFLLSHGANSNIRTIRGFTPLHGCATANNTELMRLLLDYGADPNLASQSGTLGGHGDTPLHSAANRNARNTARMLLDAGADPLLPAEGKDQPPSETIAQTFIDMVVQLQLFSQLPRVDVKAGFTKADLFAKDEMGCCPLENPVTWRQWQAITDHLATQGERITKEDMLQEGSDGRSFYAVAAEARALDMVVRDFNRHGESLEVQELAAMEEFHPLLERPHVPRALFTERNMAPLGSLRYHRNLEALPESGKAALTNRFSLNTLIARQEASHLNARGR